MCAGENPSSLFPSSPSSPPHLSLLPCLYTSSPSSSCDHQNQTGSSLSASLTSSGGTGNLRFGELGSRGPAMGSIELGTAGISTQFVEEEEDEESDSVSG